MNFLNQIDIPVWRILPDALIKTPNAAAQAPQGRFHHSGQIAAYASLSALGAGVAIKRYLGDERPRYLVPMRLKAERAVDARGNTDASIIWQDISARGAASPTWTISDAARGSGAQAMLYSSRSRPDLDHVVVFDPSCLTLAGPIARYEPVP